MNRARGSARSRRGGWFGRWFGGLFAGRSEGWFRGRRAAAALALAVPFAVWASSNLPTAEQARPPVRIPTNVAWTQETIAAASEGDPLRGLLIARRCEHCHGSEGFSAEPAIPNLAGMDRPVTWKQLEDFRSAKRESPVMQRIAGALSEKDSADLAAYYSMLPSSPDPQDTRAFPQAAPSPANAAIAAGLIAGGDAQRGIPPCQACHGPIGYKMGAPSLATQNAGYIVAQLERFATRTRANDINMPMRSIAADLTEDERHALADYYGAGFGQSPAAATAAK